MLAVWWERLCGFCQVQWRKYRSTLVWLVVWLVLGLVLGIITLIVTGVDVSAINYHLIDGNILNATAVNSSLGGFIWQRVLSILIPVTLVFLGACLSKVTALVVFPVIMMHGYWLAVAVWWTFFYYNFTALLLVVFYALWLLVVTVVILVGMLWALACGESFRHGRQGCCSSRWRQLWRGVGVLITAAVVLGFVEYLVFWTVLGKIVYKAR